MKNKTEAELLIPQEIIERSIFLVRGKKVMFDRDLARLYCVQVKALNQAVSRNIKRFPEDFMFKLNKEEMVAWKSQIVTSKGDIKGLRKPPTVFTEQGVAMLASVLRSDKAIEVNIQIIRTFVKIREMIINNKELRRKLEEMESKYDAKFATVFKVIARLISDPERENKRKIGFDAKK